MEDLQPTAEAFEQFDDFGALANAEVRLDQYEDVEQAESFPHQQSELHLMRVLLANSLVIPYDDVAARVCLHDVLNSGSSATPSGVWVENYGGARVGKLLLACTIPVSINFDPNGISVGLAHLSPDRFFTTRDPMLAQTLGTEQLIPSLQLWYTLELCCMFALTQLLKVYHNTLNVTCQMLSDSENSGIKAVRVVISGRFRPSAEDALNSHLVDKNEDFEDSKKDARTILSHLTKALTLSCTDFQSTLSLHRSMGWLATGNKCYKMESFHFLPTTWKNKLWSNQMRESVLAHFDKIFHARFAASAELGTTSTEKAVSLMNQTEQKGEESSGFIQKTKEDHKQGWRPFSTPVCTKTQIPFTGFMEWDRNKSSLAKHTIYQGFSTMSGRVGRGYGCPTDFSMEVSAATTLTRALIPYDSASEHPQPWSLFLNAHTTYMHSGVVDAVSWGVKNQARVHFFFRKTGFHRQADVWAEDGRERDYADNKFAEFYYTTPYIEVSKNAIDATCGRENVAALRKASTALRDFVVTSKGDVTQGRAASCASCPIFVVEEKYHNGIDLFRGQCYIMDSSKSEHYLAALTDILRRTEALERGAYVRTLVSHLAAVKTMAPELSNTHLLKMPWTTVSAGLSREYLVEMNGLMRKIVDVLRTRREPSHRIAPLNVVSGPFSLVLPESRASHTDNSTMGFAVPSVCIPFFKELAKHEVDLGSGSQMEPIVAATIQRWATEGDRLKSIREGIASQFGYSKGRKSVAPAHFLVAWAELTEQYKHSSTANWTQVRDSNALTAAVPPVFANLRIPPSYVLPGMIRPLYDQLSAASTVMAQTLKDIVQSAGLSAVGQQIVRLKVMQFTTFMNRQIAAHAFLNGVTSAGKSFGSRVAMNVGFTQFYRQVDQSSLRAPHHGTERFNHTIRFMNETADDLVGKAKGPGKSGPGGNGAGANTASVSATTLLTSMDSDKLVMERMTHTEKKTGLVTKQEFVLDMVVSGSQFQITLLGNLSGTEMSVPLSARLAPFVFSHPSDDTSALAKRANADAASRTVSKHVWDVLSLEMLNSEAWIQVTEYPPACTDCVNHFIRRFFYYQEMRMGVQERVTMCRRPAFETVTMKLSHEGNTAREEDTSSNYTRSRLRDVAINTLAPALLQIRLTTCLSWLSPLLAFVPEHVYPDAIKACFQVCGAEEAMGVAYLQGNFDSLMVASNNLGFVKVFLAPVVKSFFHALIMYAYIVDFSTRWVKQEMPDVYPEEEEEEENEEMEVEEKDEEMEEYDIAEASVEKRRKSKARVDQEYKQEDTEESGVEKRRKSKAREYEKEKEKTKKVKLSDFRFPPYPQEDQRTAHPQLTPKKLLRAVLNVEDGLSRLLQWASLPVDVWLEENHGWILHLALSFSHKIGSLLHRSRYTKHSLLSTTTTPKRKATPSLSMNINMAVPKKPASASASSSGGNRKGWKTKKKHKRSATPGLDALERETSQQITAWYPTTSQLKKRMVREESSDPYDHHVDNDEYEALLEVEQTMRDAPAPMEEEKETTPDELEQEYGKLQDILKHRLESGASSSHGSVRDIPLDLMPLTLLQVLGSAVQWVDGTFGKAGALRRHAPAAGSEQESILQRDVLLGKRVSKLLEQEHAPYPVDILATSSDKQSSKVSLTLMNEQMEDMSKRCSSRMVRYLDLHRVVSYNQYYLTRNEDELHSFENPVNTRRVAPVTHWLKLTKQHTVHMEFTTVVAPWHKDVRNIPAWKKIDAENLSVTEDEKKLSSTSDQPNMWRFDDPASVEKKVEFPPAVKSMCDALASAHSMRKSDVISLWKRGLIKVASAAVLKKNGAPSPAEGGLYVSIPIMDAYANKTATSLAISDTLDEYRNAKGTHPLIFTEEFSTVEPSVEGLLPDHLVNIRHVPAFQKGRKRTLEIDKDSQSAVAMRLASLLKNGVVPLRQGQRYVFKNQSDDYLFHLKARWNLMPSHVATVRHIFCLACTRYVHAMRGDVLSAEEQEEAVTEMSERAFMAMTSTAKCRQFAVDYLFVDRNKLQSYQFASMNDEVRVAEATHNEMSFLGLGEKDAHDASSMIRRELDFLDKSRLEDNKQDDSLEDEVARLGRHMNPVGLARDLHRHMALAYNNNERFKKVLEEKEEAAVNEAMESGGEEDNQEAEAEAQAEEEEEEKEDVAMVEEDQEEEEEEEEEKKKDALPIHVGSSSGSKRKMEVDDQGRDDDDDDNDEEANRTRVWEHDDGEGSSIDEYTRRGNTRDESRKKKKKKKKRKHRERKKHNTADGAKEFAVCTDIL